MLALLLLVGSVAVDGATDVQLCARTIRHPLFDNDRLHGFHVVLQWVSNHESNDALRRQRQTDYDDALRMTLANVHVDSVHLVVETEAAWHMARQFETLAHHVRAVSGFNSSERLHCCVLGHRASYADLTRYAQLRLASLPVILTNADIGVGEGLERARPAHMEQQKLLYAPTRYALPGEPTEGCACQSSYSIGCADTFMMIAFPTMLQHIVETTELPFGEVYGGENVFMYEARRAGYRISNPCRTLVMWHYQRVRHSNELSTRYGRVNGMRSAVAGGPTSL